MKNKRKELDVDSIGVQQEPITVAEELAISDFIRKLKESRQQPVVTGKKIKASSKANQLA